MLENVIGNYLDNLKGKEREFDAPFMALLRANNYSDIHFTHGQFEFGKDFLAKGYDEQGTWCQFVFQTKGGNIGQTEWREIRGQIDELRTNELSHPSFDPTLPRRAVLVTTGRLVGGAILEAQSYRQHLAKLRELGFILWDRENLIEKMLHSPQIGLAGSSNSHLLQIIGQIDRKIITQKELENFSRNWVTTPESISSLWKATLEAALVANDLSATNRNDLACFIALALIRAAWASSHGIEPLNSISLAVDDLGQRLFKYYALSIWENCTEDSLDPFKFHSPREGLAIYVTGSVRCAVIVETLGLLGLLESVSNPTLSNEIADFLRRFFTAHQFSTHLISDKWAVSLVPPVLLFAKAGFTDEIQAILENVIRRTCDHYDNENFGLASPYATVEQEVNYFLGSPLEHVPLTRRSESYISTVVLDLASILENESLYNLARNDFEAVKANPFVIETGDTLGQYVYSYAGIRQEPPNSYRNNWNPSDGWKVAAHHLRSDGEQYFLTRHSKLWQQIALSSVLRDRHFVHTCRRFLGEA